MTHTDDGQEPLGPPEDSPRHGALRIAGWVPFSTVDWPGMLACVVFLHGCPWRCGYCHNPHLQARPKKGTHAWEELEHFLQARRGLLDAVIFSGGEPLADVALRDALQAVRAMGYQTGLHTGGAYPNRLQECLPWLNWVGLDIKALPKDYAALTGGPHSGDQAWVSLAALLHSGVAYEIRTTCHPDWLPTDKLFDLAQLLATQGVQHYALQRYRHTGCAPGSTAELPASSYPGDELLGQIRPLFSQFVWRGA